MKPFPCKTSRRWKFMGFLLLVPLVVLYFVMYKRVGWDPNRAITVDFQQYLHNDGFRRGHTIPKIIHQIWSDEILPDQFVEHVKSIIKYNQHPEWLYYFWTLDIGREFIAQNYPKLLKMYDLSNKLCEEHPEWLCYFWTLDIGREFIAQNYPKLLKMYDLSKKITKADILRVVVVYHYGGAYFDLDVVGLRPLDRFVENHECSLVSPIPEFFVAYELEIDYRAVNNAIFLCRARHPFFKKLVERTEQRSESCFSNNTCPRPEFPEPLLKELTDLGSRDVPEVVDYYLFDCKYDPVITNILEKKCYGRPYEDLEPAKQNICDDWKRYGKEERLVPENAYTFHTWYHANSRKVTSDPKNTISNIVPHVKMYNSLLKGHSGKIS